MYEVELKAPADHDAVRDRLDAIGATRLDSVTQTDVYYDASHRSFAKTDEALRLRRERPTDSPADDGSSALTYKGPLVETETKTRAEIETGVEDGDATDELLMKLGFEPTATVTKRRERYRLRGYTVTLDTVEELGSFVEVERMAETEDLDDAGAGIVSILEALGVDADDGTTTSYLEMVLDRRTANDTEQGDS